MQLFFLILLKKNLKSLKLFNFYINHFSKLLKITKKQQYKQTKLQIS